MQGEGTYRFDKDGQREADRLTAVERAFDPISKCLLRSAGVDNGWRCWEVGAGNGSLARWLGRTVGPEGTVLATDLVERSFDGGATGVAFLIHDVAADPIPDNGFDLIHARFLLEHLQDPEAVIHKLRDALRPGGALVLEDSAGLQIDVAPGSAAFEELVPAWEMAARTVDWDASYGSRLLSDLQKAELNDVRGHHYRQLAPGGEAWAHLRAGLERLADQLIEQGISHTAYRAAIACLADPARLITGPPLVLATARR